VTRSLTKQCKGYVIRRQSIEINSTSGKEMKKGSPREADSTKTTESMFKLANEALEFGEKLGIRVISKRENALKRITNSLKNKHP